MGVKEYYLEKIQRYMEQFELDTAILKVAVEKKGLGDNPEWLACLHTLQQEAKHLAQKINHMRKHANMKSRHTEKLNIETTLNKLDGLIRHGSQQFLGTSHPHPRW